MTQLLDEGFDIETRDYAGKTPLIRAFELLGTKTAELLIERGANLMIPFYWAVGGNRWNELQTLISEGVDINAKDINGNTPLFIAAANGGLQCVDMLVSAGVEVDAKNHNGYTALHAAASKGYVDVLAYLIYAGADVNAKSDSNTTPIGWAAKSGNIESVKFLISNGANVCAKDKDGVSPLDVADTDEKKGVLQEAMDKQKPKWNVVR